VGNRDDVPGSAFQAIVEMSSDKEHIYLDVDVACSSTTLNALVEAGDASFVLHVECGNTLYRRAFDFGAAKHRVAVSSALLNDAVEVNVFARATKALHSYRVDKSHTDYGTAAFEIRKDDVLAIAEGQLFHIDSSFDSMARIGSIMQIQEAAEEGDLPIRADFNGDKIVVILAKKDFADYKALKGEENIVGLLTTTIVLPVLIEALHILENERGADEERWMRALRRRIDDLGLNAETDQLIVAQRLLELPVRRALVAAWIIADK